MLRATLLLASARLSRSGLSQTAPAEATYNPICASGEADKGRWKGVEEGVYHERVLGGFTCRFDNATLAQIDDASLDYGPRLAALLNETKRRYDALSPWTYELVLRHVPIYFEFDYCAYPADESAFLRERHKHDDSDCYDQQFSYSGWHGGATEAKVGAVEAWRWRETVNSLYDGGSVFIHELLHAFHDAIADITGGGDVNVYANCCPYAGYEDNIGPAALQEAWQAEGDDRYINIDEYFAYMTEAYLTEDADVPTTYCADGDDDAGGAYCPADIGTCDDHDADDDACYASCEDIIADWGWTCQEVIDAGVPESWCTQCPSCDVAADDGDDGGGATCGDSCCWYDCDAYARDVCSDGLFNHAASGGIETREDIEAALPLTYAFLTSILTLGEAELTALMNLEYERRWRYAASGTDASCADVEFEAGRCYAYLGAYDPCYLEGAADDPSEWSVSGELAVDGLALADAEAQSAVFRDAIAALSLYAAADDVSLTFAAAARRRLDAGVVASYVVAVTSQVAAEALRGDLADASPADVDAALQTAAADAGAAATFAAAEVTAVSEPDARDDGAVDAAPRAALAALAAAPLVAHVAAAVGALWLG